MHNDILAKCATSRKSSENLVKSKDMLAVKPGPNTDFRGDVCGPVDALLNPFSKVPLRC